MPDWVDSVQIYVAKNVLEASLIRKTLTEHGIPCLIPGEDLDGGAASAVEENAIFVPVDHRDEALRLLQKAWDFFEPVGGDRNGVDR